MVEQRRHDYQPFYCEENVWQLAQRHDLIAGRAEVVLVIPASPRGRVACWHQRVAEPGDGVLWDYHVVLVERRGDGLQVWDLDSRLACPGPAELWLAATFQDPARVPPRYHPRFRVMPAERYLRELATDRSHMRDAHGHWLKPPPPWEPPGAPAMNLTRWLTTSPDAPGLVLDRAGLLAHWESARASPVVAR